ncbi:hypothetical protein F4677DRAFT_238510 [Hypoxylon crocopeplum]|nr:hypothetical protein F4677DRAFT_238510 [Hypoxylon crocopeplum]
MRKCKDDSLVKFASARVFSLFFFASPEVNGSILRLPTHFNPFFPTSSLFNDQSNLRELPLIYGHRSRLACCVPAHIPLRDLFSGSAGMARLSEVRRCRLSAFSSLMSFDLFFSSLVDGHTHCTAGLHPISSPPFVFYTISPAEIAFAID